MMTEGQLQRLVRSACAGFAEGLLDAIIRVDQRIDVSASDDVVDESGFVDAQDGDDEVSHCDRRFDRGDSDEREDSSIAIDPEELARVVSQMTEPVPAGFYDPMDSREEMTPWMRAPSGIPSGPGA